jgi:hypothetical protein
MDYSDFKKLSGILRADLHAAREAKAQTSACLFQMIQAFQDYSARERPEKYKSFVEFAEAYRPIYQVAFPVRHGNCSRTGWPQMRGCEEIARRRLRCADAFLPMDPHAQSVPKSSWKARAISIRS